MYTIKHANIDSNTASQSGGGIYSTSGSINDVPDTLINIKVQYNAADYSGGGIYLSDYQSVFSENLLVANNSVGLAYNNSTTYGGGLYLTFNNNSLDSYFKNVTITKNIAHANNTSYGGGVYKDGYSRYYFINSIVWHNSADQGTEAYSISYDRALYSNFGNMTSTLNTDPLFSDLSNNDFTLSNFSPSIGTGTLDNSPLVDINGDIRPNPEGSNPDMGAFENSLGERLTGATYYVSISGSDTSNGSESSPYSTIQRALSSSWDGDTVIVLPGTYEGDVDFMGKDVVLVSKIFLTENESYIDSTIILGKVSISGDVDSTAIFKGFTITGDYSDRGLKIYTDHDPLIEHIKVVGVGGVEFDDANASLYNSIISFNDHSSSGGGVHISNSEVKLINVIIDSNSSNSYGGGIYIAGTVNDSSKVILDSVIVNGNESSSGGGGIYINHESEVVILNSEVNFNNSSSGGGIYQYSPFNDKELSSYWKSK